MYCINSCRFSSLHLPDEDYVFDKSFPKYSTTPHRGIAQDILFYCCHEYVGLICGKGFPHCGALRDVNKIYHYTLLYKSQSIEVQAGRS